MIKRRFIFGKVDLTDKGILETVKYSNLSISHNVFERTNKPSIYRNSKRNEKEVSVNFRIITDTTNPIEIENQMDKIVADLKYEDYAELNLSDKFCRAVLSSAENTVYGNTGLMELIFVNYDGLFYSSEKTIQLKNKIENNGVDDTDNVIFEINPYLNKVTLAHITTGNKIIMLDVKPNETVYVNLETKTVKQNTRHVKLDSLSDFFVLRKGINNFALNGGTCTVKVREVVAL